MYRLEKEVANALPLYLVISFLKPPSVNGRLFFMKNNLGGRTEDEKFTVNGRSVDNRNHADFRKSRSI
ncbi:hypothetical protein KZO01_05340 [Kurthia zopfii]|nr:hypothetical protein KZO01_05340 [Kurthia zopfii]